MERARGWYDNAPGATKHGSIGFSICGSRWDEFDWEDRRWPNTRAARRISVGNRMIEEFSCSPRIARWPGLFVEAGGFATLHPRAPKEPERERKVLELEENTGAARSAIAGRGECPARDWSAWRVPAPAKGGTGLILRSRAEQRYAAWRCRARGDMSIRRQHYQRAVEETRAWKKKRTRESFLFDVGRRLKQARLRRGFAGAPFPAGGAGG